MEEVRWGIIGCGDVTERKSGPAFNKIERSKLIAVMRRSTEKARDYAQRHRIPKWYDNADELIHDPEINAVYIATPPNTHKEYTIKAATAGKPVYVEKPMALNVNECEKMLAVCHQQNVSLFVAYYRRRLPAFLKVKELLEQGAIGSPKIVNVHLYQSPHPQDFDRDALPWRVIPEISGGGYFVDLASHQFDILDYLLGPIIESNGIAKNQANLYPAEDCVTANFFFQSGIIGAGIWNFTLPPDLQTDSIEIAGDLGKIIFPCFQLDQPVILQSKSVHQTFFFPQEEHVQLPLIQTVVSSLLGNNECPSTGETAIRTNTIIDAILKTYYQTD